VDAKLNCYACLSPDGCWYQIYWVDKGHRWQGPYRDKTDAENAAEDEAKRSNWELTWTE
jgi:hypothetical protein